MIAVVTVDSFVSPCCFACQRRRMVALNKTSEQADYYRGAGLGKARLT
jgi:hypothetical protein